MERVIDMKNIDILFFVEHKDRELDGSQKVIQQLLHSQKYSIAIANIEFGFFDAFFRYNPKVICLPYCRSIQNHIANAFYTRNNKTIFLNLNYEQIYNPVTIIYKRPVDDFAKKTIMHIAWGENFKKYLIDNGVSEENIVITGKPEIYFLKQLKHNSPALKERLSNEFQLSLDCKWVFIPLNDGTAFMSEDRIKAEIQRKVRMPESLTSHRVAKKQVCLLLEYIEKYLKHHEDVEIILRPHPGVNVEEYMSLLKQLRIEVPSKLHFIRDYSVKEWLCCSDICISNWSTVILDASAIDVPTYVFQPELLPNFLNAQWIEIFKKITDYTDFEKVLQENSQGSVSNTYIGEYIDTTKNPIEEIASLLQILVRDNEAWKGRVYSIGAFQREWKHLIRSKLRTVAYKTILFRKCVNKKLLYDYFEEKTW